MLLVPIHGDPRPRTIRIGRVGSERCIGRDTPWCHEALKTGVEDMAISRAQLWVAPAQYSFPLDLPLPLQGFPASVKVLPSEAEAASVPWAEQLPYPSERLRRLAPRPTIATGLLGALIAPAHPGRPP